MSWYRELRAVRGKKLLLPLANVARCTEARKREEKYYKSLEKGERPTSYLGKFLIHTKLVQQQS